MPASTIHHTDTFQLIRTSCGHEFYMDPGTYDIRHDDGKLFWCPVCGNSQYWSENTIAQLERRAELAERRSAANRAQAIKARKERDHEKARRIGYQGEVTKTRKRIGKGVCPCCNRHFANVERHMANQHPEYTP